MPGDEPGLWLTTIVGQPGGADEPRHEQMLMQWPISWRRSDFVVQEGAVGIKVAMQRLVGVCIAIGVFCAVCHLYVLHTGGILIMPDGIYTIHERSRGAGKLLPSTAVLSLHRNLFGALF